MVLPKKTESLEQVDETQHKINPAADIRERHSPKGGRCCAGVTSVRQRKENGFENEKEAGR